MKDRDLPRLVAAPLSAALRSSPVVVLTGARQTGKNTLAQHGATGAKRTYLSLDEVGTLGRAQHEPDALVRDADRLPLDEVQRSPALLLAVKRAVDEDRAPGRFLLTGSANLALMKQASESLLPVEVKATTHPRSGDADNLRAFRDEYGRLSRAGLLLHAGKTASWLAEGVLAAPWWGIV